MTIRNSKELTFIDLFAGCGGLSLGLMQAGWTGVFAIEKSPDAFNTLSYNLCHNGTMHRFNWPKWLPCRAITTRQLLNGFSEELVQIRGTIDIIAGGPPCQGFSFIGRRNDSDPRNRLTSEYIRIVDLVRPRFLILENVRGFQVAFKNGNKPYSDRVKNKLESLIWGGYKVYSRLIEASESGVPQPRPRFIMLAIRHDLDSLDKDPFKTLDSLLPRFRMQRKLCGSTTVKEAISDLEIYGNLLVDSEKSKGFRQLKYQQPNVQSPYQELMRKHVPKGYIPNSLRLPNHREETIKRFTEVLKICPKGRSISKSQREYFKIKKQCFTPLHPNMLGTTVTTLPDDTLHYSEPRILTVRENARLQSFPDWFSFQGKYTTGGERRKTECPRYTQVGNAVPPLMAEVIGLALMRFATI